MCIYVYTHAYINLLLSNQLPIKYTTAMYIVIGASRQGENSLVKTLCHFKSYFQIAAKINPQGVTNNQDPQKKRPLEDCPGKN
jgi:hypothetical protein